jgi:inorganic pyrophosphatase/exopolyphosphatase
MREDFVLRREATYLLQLAGVDTSLLTFLDDLDFEKWESTVNSGSGEKVRFPRGALTLVDHNAPEGPFTSAYWYDATEEIVDHHRDDGKVTHVTGAARNISFDESVGKGVGSTCTLVASAAKSRVPSVLKQEPALTKVLMGTILLDTVNCSESAGKTTSQDKTIVQELKELLPSEANFEPEYVLHTSKKPSWILTFHSLLQRGVFGIAPTKK